MEKAYLLRSIIYWPLLVFATHSHGVSKLIILQLIHVCGPNKPLIISVPRYLTSHKLKRNYILYTIIRVEIVKACLKL